MVKKIILILLMCLMQSPVNGMHQQDTGEEEKYQSSSTHLGRSEPEIESKIRSAIEPKHKKVHVLFLCTGNSCRSQMAEGWTRYLGSDIAEVNSAGIKAHGLNPNAVKIMQEAGIDITTQASKIVSPSMIQWADFVVTVCGDADEKCPILPIEKKKIHWLLKDPAKAIGNEEEIIKQFRAVRDEIYERIVGLLTDFRESF